MGADTSRGRRCPARPFMLLVLLGALLASSRHAAADPIVVSFFPFDLLVLMLINLPLNLFWFSLALFLVLRGWDKLASRVPSPRRRFVGRVIWSAVVISFLGSIIDVFVVIQTLGPGGMDFTALGIALALIFTSVYAVSLGMMRTGLVGSLAPAALVTAMNPPFWMLRMLVTPGEFNLLSFLLPLAFIPLCAASMHVLSKWHRLRFPVSSEGSPSGAA